MDRVSLPFADESFAAVKLAANQPPRIRCCLHHFADCSPFLMGAGSSLIRTSANASSWVTMSDTNMRWQILHEQHTVFGYSFSVLWLRVLIQSNNELRSARHHRDIRVIREKFWT